VEVIGAPVDEYTLDVERIRVVAGAPVGTLASTPRSTRVLVLRLFWGARPPARPTTTTVRERVVEDSRAWFGEVSRGRYQVSGTVTRWLRIPHPGDCFQGTFVAGQRGLDAAVRAGYNVRAFGRVVFYLPCNAGGVLGLGSMPGPFVWLYGNLLKSAIMHEQGHNLGLPHASARLCEQKGWGATTWSSRCSVSEYGDEIDSMGNRRSGHFNAYYKSRLGWLSRWATVRSTKTVRLTPYEKGGRGLKAARVVARGATYWLEYRAGSGADRGLTKGTAGVQIRYQTRDGRTELLDAGPGTTVGYYDFADPHLPAGSSWTTPQNVRITVTGQTPRAATVAIRFGAPPRAPGSVGTVTAQAGTDSVRLAWKRPPDNGSIIRRYVITRLNDGARRTVTTTGGITTSFRWGGLTPRQTYRFSVRAVNQVGVSPEVRSPSVRTLDDRPTVVIGNPANGASVQGVVSVQFTPGANPHTRMPIYWVEVFVDGGSQATFWGAPWGPYQWDTRGLANGQHTIRVVVTDSNGKTAARSVAVTVSNPTPTVAITDPVDGETVAGQIDVHYTLAPAGWDWQYVDLYVDGWSYGSVSPGDPLPVDTTWIGTGQHTLRVVATDGRWNAYESPPVTINIP
jgi:hypothetical protein